MSERAEEAALRAYPPTHSDGKRHTKRVQSEFVDTHQSVRTIFQNGYELAEKDLGWHSVDECLPPIDEEVIVLTDIITKDGLKVGFGRICFGHIVDKNIAVDYNGWNIPGVRYWMRCPKIPEE